jgi:hypothetical protein
VDPNAHPVQEFPIALCVALGLLFLAGFGVVVFVLLSGRRTAKRSRGGDR